jgi:branched-chain amino acid aminotransferase
MFITGTEWVWMDGEFIRWQDATVHVSTHTLHLGSGVFEALRCYQTDDGPAVFRIEPHTERLFASAAIYEMEIPYSRRDIEQAVCDTIAKNHLTNCYVRVLCYHGSGALGVYPKSCPIRLAILAWPMGAYLGADSLETGIRATISSWMKFHSRMMPTTAKACGQYLNSLLALKEAIKKGYDEAILVDINGNVAEGTGENIFVVRNGCIVTNDEKSSILLGITREAVIALARDSGFCVEIREIKVEELISADEAFFTGTAAEVTPIREIDGKSISFGKPGAITRAIQKDFFAVISGNNSKYRHWLRFLPH